MSDHNVLYGEHSIAFSLSWKDTLKGKIAIHVQPDARVLVDAPAGTAMREVKGALLKRARWVHDQIVQAEQQRHHVLPRLYVSGETHWYLGKRYLLKIKIAKTQPADTKLSRGLLTVTLPEYSAEAVRAQLESWYRSRASVLFKRRLDVICSSLSWVRQVPHWQLRSMSKQWGSCSPLGKLSLNPLLVKAPRDCIDYVLMHELCHLQHHNHGPQFYRLLKRQLPYWELIKCRLDGFAEQILNR